MIDSLITILKTLRYRKQFKPTNSLSGHFTAYKKEKDKILAQLDDVRNRIDNGALIDTREQYSAMLRELGNLRGAIIDLRGAEPE